MNESDFEYFAALAIAGLGKAQAVRVAIALDCAIAFGAYQARTGNESLALCSLGELNDAYAEKIAKLEKHSHG